MKCGRLAAACVGIAVLFCTVGTDAYASEAIIVPVEEGIELADRSGQLYVHMMNSGTLYATVDKTEPEGIFRYYNTELVNDNTSGSTVYQMELSRCEYLVDSGKYASVYTVSFSADKGGEAVYTVQFSVRDTDFEGLNGNEIHFYITTEPAIENGFQLLGDIEYEDDSGVIIFEHHVMIQYACKLQGDADRNGEVNIADATAVLTYYASKSAGLDTVLSSEDADTDGNGEVGINDATAILTYYAMSASGLEPEWSDIIK